MRYIYHPPIKHIDRSSDYLLGERRKIKKVGHTYCGPELNDVP